MLDILKLCAAFAVLVIATWVFFLAVMMLRHARDAGRMPKPTVPFAYFVLAIGYALDVMLNLASSILFIELPREILFTARISRHIREGKGWRKKLATWFCDGFLNPFDAGHCH